MKVFDRNIVAAGIAGTTALLGFSCAGGESERPNVIIIYGDDVGYGDLSCNGYSTVETPNVDRLASEGVRFTNAHSTSSTSTPSRYGLLTGQYPWRKKGTGIAAGDAGMIIDPSQYTMADMFRDAGYTTGAVGKWHLGIGVTAQQDWNGTISPGLSDIGFDYSFIMAATGDRVPCVYIENERVVGLDPADPISVSYNSPFEGEPTGKDNPELLRIHPSNGHNQAIVDGISRIGYMKGGKSALWHDEDIADRITDAATGFIRENAGSPFFLYFGTNDIHVPRVPHERFAGKSGMGPRGDAILSFDYCVGRIIDLLDELGIADNTIIILSSDNGPVIDDGYKDQSVELLGDHKPWGGFRGGKYSIFEAGTRIPMIVRWPGNAPQGTVTDKLFSHIDLFSSFASICGAAIPEGAAPDSRDISAALTGGGKGAPFAVEQSINSTLSFIEDDWKYIEPSNGQAYNKTKNIELGHNPLHQLYNLKDDPGEKKNLAQDYPERVDVMKAKLEGVRNAVKGTNVTQTEFSFD